MNLSPNVQPLLSDLLKQEEQIQELIQDEQRVVHFVLPKQLANNIEAFTKIIGTAPVQIYLAHKATTSPALIQQAKKSGINIDVASERELASALQAGFSAEHIECTGPKSNGFLKQAIQHNCLISIDSINELKRIAATKQQTRILIRINNPDIGERTLIHKRSKFGILQEQLSQAYNILAENQQIQLRGFHFHKDGYDPSMKASIAEHFIQLILQAKQYGHNANIINLGGALSTQQFAKPNQWQEYIAKLQKKLTQGMPIHTWSQQANGMYMENSVVKGRETAEKAAHNLSATAYLRELLNAQTSHGVSLQELLTQCAITLIIEPGSSLLHTCGCTLIPIIETKSTTDYNLVVCNANMFSIGSRMFPQRTDIHMIPSNTQSKPYQAYLVGNLCREDDVLNDRQLTLPRKPTHTDIIILANTAAYQQSYEEAQPQMQQTPAHYTATKIKTWRIQHDSTNT